MGFICLKRYLPVNFLLTILFTTLGLAVMGYHPGFEDDGIYLTAVKFKLNPTLYSHDSGFFRFQMQASYFDTWVAGFVRWTGIPVAATELFWQFASIALVVFGCWAIARRLFPETRAQWAGVALVTAMFTLPAAGTALYLVDQHLHPRTIATGLILLAVSRILAGKSWQAVPFYCWRFCCILSWPRSVSRFAPFLLWSCWNPNLIGCGDGMALDERAIAVFFVPLGWVFEPPNPAWRQSLEMRKYLFLYRWEWYEWLGALAPLVLFWLLWRIARKHGETLLARFALAVFIYGVFHQAVAMILQGFPALIRLIPLQPMRFLHLTYFFLMLVGGCLLGKYLLKASVWRWAVFLLVINAGMFASQRMQFSSIEHLELPGRASANPWLQAFAWIRQNTPSDAFFALDPEYLAAPGEDYHSFRALAERSQLADKIKDGSVVTQVPELSEVWKQQLQAQKGWAHFQLADFERLKTEFGVNWVLVAYPQPSGLDCQWHNNSLAVCRIP